MRLQAPPMAEGQVRQLHESSRVVKLVNSSVPSNSEWASYVGQICNSRPHAHLNLVAVHVSCCRVIP